jgi:glycosyltransferase involved in cell wall biosynthesis
MIGVAGARVETRTVDSRTAMRLQKECDLLYLPLGFDTPWKDEVRTVYPTKAVEYLVSETPILLHAPGDSYTAHEAREMGWALVVDRQDPAMLQQAIVRLLSDNALREKLRAAARSAAGGRDQKLHRGGPGRDLGVLW